MDQSRDYKVCQKWRFAVTSCDVISKSSPVESYILNLPTQVKKKNLEPTYHYPALRVCGYCVVEEIV